MTDVNKGARVLNDVFEKRTGHEFRAARELQQSLSQYPIACALSFYEHYVTKHNLKEATYHIDPGYLEALQQALVMMQSKDALPTVASSDYSLSLCLLLSGSLAGSVVDDRLIAMLLGQTATVENWYSKVQNAPSVGTITSRNGRFDVRDYVVSAESTCSGILAAHDRVTLPLSISGIECISSERMLSNFLTQFRMDAWKKALVGGYQWYLDVSQSKSADMRKDRTELRALDRIVATIGSHAVLLTHFIVRTLLRYYVGQTMNSLPGTAQATLLSLVDVVRENELPLLDRPMPITTKRRFRVMLSRIRFYSTRYHREGHRRDERLDDVRNFDAPSLFPPRSTFYALCDFERERKHATISSVPFCVSSDSPLVHLGLPCFPPIFHLLPVPVHVRRHTTVAHILKLVATQCTQYQLVYFQKGGLVMHAPPNTIAHVLALLLRSLRSLVLLRAPHRKRALLKSFDILFSTLWDYMATHASSRVPFSFPATALGDDHPARAWEEVHHAVVDAQRAERKSQQVEKTTVRDAVMSEMMRELRDHTATVICSAQECTNDMTVGQCLEAQAAPSQDGAAHFEQMRARVDLQQKCAATTATLSSVAQLDASVRANVDHAVDQVHAAASHTTEELHAQLHNRWSAFLSTAVPPVGMAANAWPVLRSDADSGRAPNCVVCFNTYVVRHSAGGVFRCHLARIDRSLHAKNTEGEIRSRTYPIPGDASHSKRKRAAEEEDGRTLYDEIEGLVAVWWRNSGCRDARAHPRITGLQSFLNIVQVDVSVSVGSHYVERGASVHDPSVAVGTDEHDVLFVGPYDPSKQIRYTTDWVTMSDENVTLVP